MSEPDTPASLGESLHVPVDEARLARVWSRVEPRVTRPSRARLLARRRPRARGRGGLRGVADPGAGGAPTARPRALASPRWRRTSRCASARRGRGAERRVGDPARARRRGGGAGEHRIAGAAAAASRRGRALLGAPRRAASVDGGGGRALGGGRGHGVQRGPRRRVGGAWPWSAGGCWCAGSLCPITCARSAWESPCGCPWRASRRTRARPRLAARGAAGDPSAAGAARAARRRRDRAARAGRRGPSRGARGRGPAPPRAGLAPRGRPERGARELHPRTASARPPQRADDAVADLRLALRQGLPPSLAESARARIVEACARLGDHEGAAQAAAEYRRLHPRGEWRARVDAWAP